MGGYHCGRTPESTKEVVLACMHVLSLFYFIFVI